MDAIRAFTYQQLAYQKYVAAETALRNLILQSIEDKYINELDWTHISNTSQTHDWDNYATFDDADHAIIEENMRRQWSPSSSANCRPLRTAKKGSTFRRPGKRNN